MAKTHKRMARLERMMAKLLAEVAYLKDELITKPEAERVLKRLQEEQRYQELHGQYEKMAQASNRLTNAPGAQLQSGVALKHQYQQSLKARVGQPLSAVEYNQRLDSIQRRMTEHEKHILEHAKEMMLDEEG
jgi:hypothetical protein